MKKLFSGNEAVALGAYDFGVRVASAYPGTPSTEILENLARYEGVYAEWAPNEKVALDVAIGAAYTGARALAAMKHVGLNVAADSLFYSAYTGVCGGLVIVTADDPALHSSQNEQDNRHYARFARVPMLEPSDSQEAHDFVGLALEMSERFECPVLLRITTRIAHSKTLVDTNAPARRDGAAPTFGHIVKDPSRFVMVPANARRRHPVVEERIRQLAEYAETCPANVMHRGHSELGIITSGIACQYAREVFPEASFLKLGMTYPLPRRMILDFAASVDRVIVVEELDPFLEEQVRLLGVEADGKSLVSNIGELSVDALREAARRAGLPLGEAGVTPDAGEPPTVLLEIDLPNRPPALCPGCGHRGVFYILSKLKLAVAGDIGCYSLGVAPPLSAMHTLGCMGAGVGVLHGALKAGAPERAVAVIGDSTFFHSGIAPLINIVYNRSAGVTIILDNHTTAMTGHQPHPGTGNTLQGELSAAVSTEGLVRALGVRHVAKVDPYDLRATEKAIKDALAAGEPAVVIAERPCLLLERRKGKALSIDSQRCNACGLCQRLGCPAISKNGQWMHIDEILCSGCGLCSQVCARKAVVSQ
ncbi:MAG: indolepyruvate ferredoxin oxidoreductase subunit alpha [Chloroflexota bacterium]